MSLNSDQVRKVAQLAQLRVQDDQIAGYTRELSSILDVVARLEQVDTHHIQPMSHPLDLNARLRPDSATPVVDREAFQALAPATANGVYLVPKVIE